MSEIPFQYRSVSGKTTGLYKEKGSKFLAYLCPVKSISDIEEALESIKNEHPKSRHVCYAYRLGIEGEPYRFNDDGEPSGTAGRPIYNELLSNNLSDVLCAVVRYFGGTKLGVSGLIKAYKSSSNDAIDSAEVQIVTLTNKVKITYRIEDMGRIYEILKGRGIAIIQNQFTPHPHLSVEVALNKVALIRQTILADYYGYQVEDISDDFKSDRLEVVIE